jgi:peptide-methionine (S)-S-oxide reductase
MVNNQHPTSGSVPKCACCPTWLLKSSAWLRGTLTRPLGGRALPTVIGMGCVGLVFLATALSLKVSIGSDEGGKTTTSQDSAVASPVQAGAQGQEGDWQVATFGNGCFWCTEAVFQRVQGVLRVTSGYMGGHVPNPTYEMVLTKKTGHAEVLHLVYDPNEVSYEKLLEIFWKTHDPTTLNRQGNDVGPQYRSAVFYHTPEQKELAEKYKKLLDESKAFRRPIVTEITEAGPFYPAENYHQNYYNLNKNRNPYCKQIEYKLQKFRQVFPEVIDPEKDRVK